MKDRDEQTLEKLEAQAEHDEEIKEELARTYGTGLASIQHFLDN